MIAATQPAQVCHGTTGLLQANPGLQLTVVETHTFTLGTTFSRCTGPYVTQAKLAASFKTRSLSCQTAVGVASTGTGTFIWTAPSGLGTSTASIEFTIDSTAGHSTLVSFRGSITSR